MKIGKRINHEIGYTETVKKFAYLPKFMTNGDLVIWESYVETRKWDSSGLFMAEPYCEYWNIIERKRV